jgi:cbb3-type cytochrome oxidase subunit 3
MVLIALVLQAVGGAIVVGLLGWVIGFSVLYPYAWAWVAVLGAAVGVAVIGLFLYCAYAFSYRRVRAGEYEAAQTPTLVLGILSMFLGIVPGIFYLIGYVKLGDALQEAETARLGAGMPAPGSLVACKGCGRVFPIGGFSFCPACGQRLGA